ncbi:MAG: M23 family metallopeptidase [Marinagarivorans sp.]|nr:M23 family metallopeptidase [Marinagarivorans sp.]
MKKYGSLFLLLSLCFAPLALAGTVYKYQDKNGKWKFSDKPPADKTTTETLEFSAEVEDTTQLNFNYYKDGTEYLAETINPFYIAIELKVEFDNPSIPTATYTIPAREKFIFYRGTQKTPAFNYQYVWGAPKPKLDNSPYRIPVRSGSKQIISQGFNGRFSHNKEPSVHAVDIAVQVGTDIVAARAGTVILVQDNFVMGGVQAYFLDKANAIYIAHEDGSYATYAHLLMGSATVKVGQKVEAGDLIAQSGSSGFSSGPHLHFVIRQNSGFNTTSIPFSFTRAEGTFIPTERQTLCPCD